MRERAKQVLLTSAQFSVVCATENAYSQRCGYPVLVTPDPSNPPSPQDRVAAANLGKIRGYRVYERDNTITAAVEKARKQVRTLTRAESEAARAWELCTQAQPWPERCVFVGISRGVLSIRAEDQSVKYLADVWVRGGGESAIRSEARVAVKKVKVVV